MHSAESCHSAVVTRRILLAVKRPAVKSWTVAAAIVVGLMGGAVGFALAGYTATSCGGPVCHPVVAHIEVNYSFSETYVQYRPTWKANTTVYNSTSASSTLVGYLTYPGDGNWFICHTDSLTDPYSAWGSRVALPEV